VRKCKLVELLDCVCHSLKQPTEKFSKVIGIWTLEPIYKDF